MSSHPEPQHRPPAIPAFVWAGLVVVLFVMALPLVDFLMFSVAGKKFGRPTSFIAYVEYRLNVDIPNVGPERVVEASQPEFSDRPLGAMTIDEKRAFQANLEEILPSSYDGWKRRAYHTTDYFRLNPDLAPCQDRKSILHSYSGSFGSSGVCPRSLKSRNTVVYEKGNKLIAVRLIFQRDNGWGDKGYHIPPGKIKPRGKRDGMIRHLYSGMGNGSYWDYKYYKSFMRRGQFVFVQRERERELHKTINLTYPYRIYMRSQKDSVLDAYVISNAESYEVKRFIQRWDFQRMIQLVGPVVSGLRSGSQIEADQDDAMARRTVPEYQQNQPNRGRLGCRYSKEDIERLERLAQQVKESGQSGSDLRVSADGCDFVVK